MRTLPNYYDTPLEARAEYVGAQRIQQMLKMVFLKNDRSDKQPKVRKERERRELSDKGSIWW